VNRPCVAAALRAPFAFGGASEAIGAIEVDQSGIAKKLHYGRCDPRDATCSLT
jgi:hypothetical protein